MQSPLPLTGFNLVFSLYPFLRFSPSFFALKIVYKEKNGLIAECFLKVLEDMSGNTLKVILATAQLKSCIS